MEDRDVGRIQNDLENVEYMLTVLENVKPLVQIYLKSTNGEWGINVDYINALIGAAKKKKEYYDVERLIAGG